MKNAIKNDFIEMLNNCRDEDIVRGKNSIKYEVGNGFIELDYYYQEESQRVPAILIAVDIPILEELAKDFGLDNTYYGEVPMMLLWQYLLQNDPEAYVIDTDVLNWDILTGSCRDVYELQDIMLSEGPKNNEFLKRIFTDMEAPVAFIRVILNDYMS